MREIINFFIRNSKWFVLTAYIVVSVILLIDSSPFHQSVVTTSANAVSSSVYDMFGSMSAYVNLRENNEDLNRRNAELQAEVASLKLELEGYREKDIADSLELHPSVRPYDFIVAHVIKNSVIRPHNYLTVNKGSEDGVRPEMGVIDQNGVVGVVNVTGPHSSRIISLLNPHFRLSCKIQGNDSFGSLVWDGDDPRFAVLEELPRHTVYHIGDTVITSGYSAVFPPGIPVGVVDAKSNSDNENLFSVKVRLFTDFSVLDNVQIVVNYMADEVNSLEEDEKKLDKD